MGVLEYVERCELHRPALVVNGSRWVWRKYNPNEEKDYYASRAA